MELKDKENFSHHDEEKEVILGMRSIGKISFFGRFKSWSGIESELSIGVFLRSVCLLAKIFGKTERETETEIMSTCLKEILQAFPKPAHSVVPVPFYPCLCCY